MNTKSKEIKYAIAGRNIRNKVITASDIRLRVRLLCLWSEKNYILL